MSGRHCMALSNFAEWILTFHYTCSNILRLKQHVYLICDSLFKWEWRIQTSCSWILEKCQKPSFRNVFDIYPVLSVPFCCRSLRTHHIFRIQKKCKTKCELSSAFDETVSIHNWTDRSHRWQGPQTTYSYSLFIDSEDFRFQMRS